MENGRRLLIIEAMMALGSGYTDYHDENGNCCLNSGFKIWRSF